jgi:hypothetical protein
VLAYCRQHHCTPDQFLKEAITTELRQLMGNAPRNEIKGNNNVLEQNTTNNFNLLSGNSFSFLNDVRLFLWPTGGSITDWARAAIFYLAGMLTVIFVAINNN